MRARAREGGAKVPADVTASRAATAAPSVLTRGQLLGAMSRKRERENPCFICNHYHNFEAGELCSVCGHGPAATVERAPPPSAFPTVVVPDLLYLGSYDQAARAELLKAMGVKRILNVRAPHAPRRS
jgi:hypothetical protein